jgi:hypothetical protein
MFIDAADAPKPKDAKAPAPPPASAVKEFIDGNEKAEAKQTDQTGISATTQKKSSGTSSSTLKVGNEPVYRSYQNDTY